MSLRILHILDHSLPLQSGYAFRTVALLREQRALGWQTFQLTTPKHYAPSGEEEEVAGLHFFRTRPLSGWLQSTPVLDQAAVVLASARRIAEVARRVKPDILHAHSPCLNGLAALRVARGRGIPLVYELRASWEDAAVDHGTTHEGSLRYRLSRTLETFVLARADAVTTICQGLAQDISARGVAPERVTIVPNAVDIESFALIDRPVASLRDSLGLGPGPVLGFAGSFYAYEGLDLLVAALPEIALAHPHVRLLLVGGGPAESELRRLAAECGVAERVHFAGRVPHEAVRDYYSVIDLLVYPRKSMRLTELVTPLKPLEAMALGRPFIASDVGGHRELIPRELQAALFPHDSASELARAALALLARRSSWPAIVAAGRCYVAERCTWTHSAAHYQGAYAAALGRRPRSPPYAAAA